MIMKEYDDRLKTCPCCGGKANLIIDTGVFGGSFIYVECSKCELRTKSETPNIEYAVTAVVCEKWNKRAGDCL